MYIGDFFPAVTVYHKFNTQSTVGVPTTLSGTPVIKIYKDASTTESTSGVSLTADFDSITGLNHVSIDTSTDATFYATGHDFQIVVTTGTVSGQSVAGTVVGRFSLGNRPVNATQVGGQTAVPDPDLITNIAAAVWATTLNELSSAPSTASITANQAVMALAMERLNKVTTANGSAGWKVYNAAGTLVWSGDLSEALSVFTKTKAT